MKKILLIIFSCFVSINLYSQVNMNKFIEIRCDKYAEFDINLAADSSNTKVIFQNGYFNLPMTVQMELGYSPSYVSVALDTILRIYGDVTQIRFRGGEFSSYRIIRLR